MPGIAGRRALVKVTGAPVALVAGATATTDHQSYQLTDATKRLWDRATALVVDVGGVLTGESYTFNRLTGTVKFATVDAGRAAVTVSGAYLPTSIAVGATTASISITGSVLDDTDFASAQSNGGFQSYIPGPLSVSGSVGMRLTTDTYFRDALLAGDPVIIEIFADGTGAPLFTCWALLNKTQLASDRTSLGTNSVDYVGAPDDQQVVVA